MLEQNWTDSQRSVQQEFLKRCRDTELYLRNYRDSHPDDKSAIDALCESAIEIILNFDRQNSCVSIKNANTWKDEKFVDFSLHSQGKELAYASMRIPQISNPSFI